MSTREFSRRCETIQALFTNWWKSGENCLNQKGHTIRMFQVSFTPLAYMFSVVLRLKIKEERKQCNAGV